MKGEMMNRFFILMVTSFTLVTCNDRKEVDMPKGKLSAPVVHVNPVDSMFSANFALLDSVLTQEYYGESCPSYRIEESIIFMETITGYQSKADGTWLGRINFTDEEYYKWKEWYHENKSQLKWDMPTKSITRVGERLEQAPVDSMFRAHFALLDTMINSHSWKNSRTKYRVGISLVFMMDITGIPSRTNLWYPSPDAPILKDDVERWKKWYNENKSRLRWNNTIKRIVEVGE